MIIGAHSIINSSKPRADGAFMRDVLKLPFVDLGGLHIFGLPPAEFAVHESQQTDRQEFYLMCDDIEAFAADMKARGVAFTPPVNRGWGTLTQITLPGGGKLGVYQPHHPRPDAVASKAAEKPAAKAAKKAPAKKKAAKKSPAKKKVAKRGKRR
jgi:hypothetical protein